MIACKIENIIMQTPIFSISSEAFKRMVLKGKGAEGRVFFARKLIGRPYVAHTLEVADPECLVVNTRQLDCTTLVENATALTLCASRGKCRYGDYKKMLLALRYRDGVMAGYASRLHYFSEWIEDNTRRGMVEERQSSQTPFIHVQKIRLGFMSDNPEKYDMLRRHPEMISSLELQRKVYEMTTVIILIQTETVIRLYRSSSRFLLTLWQKK